MRLNKMLGDIHTTWSSKVGVKSWLTKLLSAFEFSEWVQSTATSCLLRFKQNNSLMRGALHDDNPVKAAVYEEAERNRKSSEKQVYIRFERYRSVRNDRNERVRVVQPMHFKVGDNRCADLMVDKKGRYYYHVWSNWHAVLAAKECFPYANPLLVHHLPFANTWLPQYEGCEPVARIERNSLIEVKWKGYPKPVVYQVFQVQKDCVLTRIHFVSGDVSETTHKQYRKQHGRCLVVADVLPDAPDWLLNLPVIQDINFGPKVMSRIDYFQLVPGNSYIAIP